MKVDEVLSTARDSLTFRRVFGEPYIQGDVTVIPAARVTGAYVIKDGSVRWCPALDVNRLVGALAAIMITAILSQLRHAKSHDKAEIARALIARKAAKRP